MKAVYYTQSGGLDVINIGEFPKPEIQSDEVLVKVAAGAFNPADIVIREGIVKPDRYPFVPICDGSGIIIDKGVDVKGFEINDKVMAFLPLKKNGAAAEYVAVKSEFIVKAPSNIPLWQCGTLPSTCITAWQGIIGWAHLEKNQRIFISGGAGGVGLAAIQIAKWRGAYVIASDSADSLNLMKEYGADEVMDYKAQSVNDILKEKVDVFFNATGESSEALDTYLKYINRGGYLISTLNVPNNLLAQEYGIYSNGMTGHYDIADVQKIADLIENGFMKPCVTAEFTLEQFVEMQKTAGLTHGKVALVVDKTL